MPSDTSIRQLSQELHLTDQQQFWVNKYHELKLADHLSLDEGEMLAELWAKAAEDNVIYQALMHVDDLASSQTEGDNRLSSNKNLRTYLSEYLPVLAQEKLDKLQGKLREITDIHKPVIVMLCPDEQGYVVVNMPEGEGFSLDMVEQIICSQCKSPLSEHKPYIYPKGIPSRY